LGLHASDASPHRFADLASGQAECILAVLYFINSHRNLYEIDALNDDLHSALAIWHGHVSPIQHE